MEVDSDHGLGELLQQAEQLNADNDSNGDLPRVKRNLQQILEGGQQLWNKVSQATSHEAVDVKASLLLGSKGYDLPRISSKLEHLNVLQTCDPLEPIRENDIEGFLKNERENAILSVIEETRKSTSFKVDQLIWKSQECEWEQDKQKILTALIGIGQELPDISVDSESVFNEKVNMKTRSSMDNVEIAYAREVYLYNESVIQGGVKQNLVEAFVESAKRLNDQKVEEMWNLVNTMVNLPVRNIGRSIEEVRSTPVFQSAIVQQARKFLEESYVKFMRGLVYDNLQQAQLGGIPGIYNLVRGFLNIKLPGGMHGWENGSVDGHPVWAMIYYCIRCGDYNAAIQVAQKAGSSIDDFIPYLQESANSEDRRLSPNNENVIRLKYRRNVRASTDPFKKIVYCVIGCCDINDDHREVADKLDDYIWLKLHQLKPEDDGAQHSPDHITLSQLQTKLVEEYGEAHFNAYQQPFLYFQVLFLTGQFEAAIEFLSRILSLRCHAVHVAIALFDLNLLALPSGIHAQLLSKDSTDKSPMCRLNFARLILMYTRKFRVTDSREAIQYFYFLRTMKGIKGEDLFMASVSELALETREFDMLLGKLEPDGCRSPGLIDKFQGESVKLIQLVAEDSESKGLSEDAVKLYHLAGKQDKVLELMTQLLCQVVAQPNIPQSRRDILQTLAINIAERFKSQGVGTDRESSGMFYLLLDIMTFFDQYHANNYQEALEIIEKLRLIPLQPEDVESKVSNFKELGEEIRRAFPDILLAVMNILYTQYRSAKSTPSQSPIAGIKRSTLDDGKDKQVSYLRRQAKSLVTFTGMIPYRMPGDTNARLVQIEVLMN